MLLGIFSEHFVPSLFPTPLLPSSPTQKKKRKKEMYEMLVRPSAFIFEHGFELHCCVVIDWYHFSCVFILFNSKMKYPVSFFMLSIKLSFFSFHLIYYWQNLFFSFQVRKPHRPLLKVWLIFFLLGALLAFFIL